MKQRHLHVLFFIFLSLLIVQRDASALGKRNYSKVFQPKKQAAKKIVAQHINEEEYSTYKFLEELPFVIMICSYNDALWVEKNLDSVFNQQYTNFRVIYVDDASRDSTAQLVEDYITKHAMQHKITLIVNDVRCRKMNNIYNAFHLCDDHEIVVQLDGDDWFAHDKVLLKLNAVFHNPNIWLSYGQFKRYPEGKIGFCREVPHHIKVEGKCREFPWVTSHVKAFYAWLIKSVKLQDLLAETVHGWEGQFYPAANDLATVLPMLDMAREKIHFVSDISYIYNSGNPMCGVKVDRSIQRKSDQEIRSLPRYDVAHEPLIGRLAQFNNAQVDVVMLARNGVSDILSALASLQDNLQGIGSVLLLYDSRIIDEEQDVQILLSMPGVMCINLSSPEAKSVQEYLSKLATNHVIFTTDDLYLEKKITITDSIKELERTFAYAVYFSVTPCLLNEHHIRYQHIRNDLYTWKFLMDRQEVFAHHNFDFTLYRKKEIAEYLPEQRVDSVATLNAIVQQAKVDARKVGLFYADSHVLKKKS